MKTGHEQAEITIGTDQVVIRRPGISTVEIAGILDIRHSIAGTPIRIVLDRRVHGPKIDTLGEWRVSGAVVSVLVWPDTMVVDHP